MAELQRSSVLVCGQFSLSACSQAVVGQWRGGNDIEALADGTGGWLAHRAETLGANRHAGDLHAAGVGGGSSTDSGAGDFDMLLKLNSGLAPREVALAQTGSTRPLHFEEPCQVLTSLFQQVFSDPSGEQGADLSATAAFEARDVAEKLSDQKRSQQILPKYCS